MLRTASVLCVVLSVWPPSGHAQPAPAAFIGDWHPLGTPDDLTRILIERKGPSFSIQIWSQCLPTDCYWGASTAELSADGRSLSAKFSRPYAELTEEFALLADGNLQVTPRTKDGLEDNHALYLTKSESDDPPSRLPLLKPLVEGPNPTPEIREPITAAPLSKVIEPAVLQCTYLIDPAAVAFDPAGGDAQVTIYAPVGCLWTTESDSPWLTVTTASSGAGEGHVALHASANPTGPRTATVTIGSMPFSATQKGFGRTWEIPGLDFGPNHWSIVRITNPSTSTRPVKIDLYRASGDRVPLKPVFDLRPQATLEVLIEPRQVEVFRRSSGSRILDTSFGGATLPEGSAWIRIGQTAEDRMPDLEVRAFVEVLENNKVTDFERPPKEPREVRSSMIRGDEVRGEQIYFLNVSDSPTNVVFCVSNKVQRDPCKKKDSFPNRFLVKPNEFLLVAVKKFPQKYFFVESSNPGLAIFAKLAPAEGATKVFTSESSISFGGP